MFWQSGFAVALCLVCWLFPVNCPAVSPAASPAVESALDQRKAEGFTLIERKSFAAAYELFMRLLRERPDDDQIVLGVARSAYGAGKYGQAMLAFEQLADRYPSNTALRLELARVYLLLGDKDSARQELDSIREHAPDITEEEIEKAMTGLERAHSRGQIRGRVSLGVIYDSNVNQGPRSNVMSLGPYDNLFVDGVKAQSAWGGYVGASLDGGYRLAVDGPWWLVADVGAYQRWNFRSDLPSNNQFTWGRAAVGVRRMGESTLLDLRVKGEEGLQQHRTMEDQGILGGGFEGTFAWLLARNTQLITRGSYEWRDYSINAYRDGEYWWVGQYLRRLFGEGGHELLVGVRVLGGETSFNDYSYTGWEGSGRLLFHLPFSVDVTPFLAYKRERYRGPATALEMERRTDEQWRAGTGVSWGFAKNFSLDLTYQYSKNSSNCALYEYKQHLVTSGISWSF